MNDHAYLQSILTGIVSHPERINIERTEDERGVLFRLNLAKDDMPYIIGKGGKNIAAIRLVMKLYAKDGPDISILVSEPQN